jgi:hypothetical protein
MSLLRCEKCGLIGHLGHEGEVIKFIQWVEAQHNIYYASLGYNLSFS